MPTPNIHIAGVGISEGLDPVAATTKALLDAGIVYGDVDLSFSGWMNQKRQVQESSLKLLARHQPRVLSVKNRSLLFVAAQSIRSRDANCTLLVGIDQAPDKRNGAKPPTVAVAIVLVSDLFLTSHAYLKDAAICIRSLVLASPEHPESHRDAVREALRGARIEAKDIQLVESQHGPSSQRALSDFCVAQLRIPLERSAPNAESSGLASLCGLVWRFRGWTDNDRSSTESRDQIHTCLQYVPSKDGSASVLIVKRSDEKRAPAWSDIKHLRDGRERLGHNPALETRRITIEDLLAVTAQDKFTSTGDKILPVESFQHLRLPSKDGDRAALARL
ncbi:hypothetical protein Tdes44962_MAKER01187 [Teratosphaeria destructans]|uniref:Uncharacterized protein n=1 Tax=Teratosphaeria destructans TaxID=418781 RepID=A0A9W7T2T1_9PEZI|nr:hypothetical protein Tdes44962_MAKER01187 [Teratosphaeria destructans]